MASQAPQRLPDLPTIVTVRPLIMLTGFLGAGKTTLLKAILDELGSRELLVDVILNDRENAAIDCDTIRDRAAGLSALTGSCVCCEGYDELIDVIFKASQSDHSALLIELNGTADPVPLQESFTLLESKFCLRPRWQVCVVDARFFGERGHFADLEILQLETASHYFVSWSDQLDADAEMDLTQTIESINPRATRTTAGELVEHLVEAIQSNRRHAVASQATGGGMFQPAKRAPDARHQLAHEFTGCNIVFPEPIEAARVQRWLEMLPESVIRTKALVEHVDEDDTRYLYERVGREISPKPIVVGQGGRAPCSAIFIGADIDPDEILRLTREHLHPCSHLAAI